MKLIKLRFIVLIDLIWIAFWSTLIYRLDGNYPGDYSTWFLIIAFVGIILPWCFLTEGHVCADCEKLIHYDEPCVKHPDPQSSSDVTTHRYYHRTCYNKLYPEGSNKEK